MQLGEYESFVRHSDWTRDKDATERIRIARYGVAAEVGSLASAIKRKILHHLPEHWNTKNDEIVEELGDCLWYATQLSTIDAKSGLTSIVEADLSALPQEIQAKPEFLAALPPENYSRFLSDAPRVILAGSNASLDDYQQVAILTARTEGKELLDVCVTRLMLYATSIMSRQFPDREYHLKDDILKFTQDRTLGMLLWHLSAIAQVYNIPLSDVARSNRKKLESISNLTKNDPTSLYDRIDGVPESQRFPDVFEVLYVSTSAKRLQMFYLGKPLGDELDDNSPVEDGYRFHDALHLANAAVLGWSPVLRSLMGLKRKYDPKKDNAEDGARARIVEEAIIKAAHSEASRAAQSEGLSPAEARQRLFSEANQISYPFLKLVMSYAEGLEVSASQPWEWQRAIVDGHRMYVKLLQEKQGTITVNLIVRSVSFSPLVIADIRGPVVDSAIEVFTPPRQSSRAPNPSDRQGVEKAAILRILNLENLESARDFIQIAYSDLDEISIKANGEPQAQMWSRSIVGFRRNWTRMGHRSICMMMAIGAPA